MALTGTYPRTLDEKRRLAVPKRLRDEFGGDDLRSLYAAPGTERSVNLYAPRVFDRLAKRLTHRDDPAARSYVRLFYSQAEKVELDGQGRVRLPDRLAEFARLEKEVVLLGVNDHAEIWDAKLWEEFVTRSTPGFDELANQVFSQP